MELRDFDRISRMIWQQIPEQFKQGIDGLVIESDPHAHAEHVDLLTLGECVTEAYPSDYGGPDNIRSAVVLYYGSFAAVASENPDFDWEHEIEETLLHELQHHLEQLADADRLSDYDYAVEENYLRIEGEAFDPLFFRAGQLVAEHTFRVEDDIFIEVPAATPFAGDVDFRWLNRRYQVSAADTDADVLYMVVEHEMPDVAGELCVVRIRRQGVVGTLRAAWSERGYSVGEVLVQAQAK
jgi:predicted Zn-dependent protease with MMP-like domain